jgi:hypothetical protein
MANKYLRKNLIPSAATETDLYVVPDANTGVLRSLRITNANASRTTITVSQYDAGSATENFLLKSYVLPTNTTFDVFNGVPCVLTAGDKIRVESSLGSCHFYLSYLEVDRN